jgi:hypothetical protein
MAELSFLDVDNRLAALSKQGDPLGAIALLVLWEEFRAEIEAVVLTADVTRRARRPHYPDSMSWTEWEPGSRRRVRSLHKLWPS